MASILLIEHQALVGDAIRHFLFPQHDVVPATELPTADELRSYDLVILDSETLPRWNQTKEQFASLLDRAEVPAVWMCPATESVPEEEPNRIFVAKPLDAEIFRRAVAQFAGQAVVDTAEEADEDSGEQDSDEESPDDEPN